MATSGKDRQREADISCKSGPHCYLYTLRIDDLLALLELAWLSFPKERDLPVNHSDIKTSEQKGGGQDTCAWLPSTPLTRCRLLCKPAR